MSEVEFPSGKKFVIPPIVTTPVGERKPLPKRRGACQHVGQAIDVEVGCSGTRLTSTWECALHGPCAPLALVQIGGGVTTCATCDDWVAAPEPGYARLGLNLLTAVAKWTKAGMPTRSQPRVDELLKVCQACPFLGRKKNGDTYCGKCGCPVNGRTDAPTTNKLALATERCPLDPPRWT